VLKEHFSTSTLEICVIVSAPWSGLFLAGQQARTPFIGSRHPQYAMRLLGKMVETLDVEECVTAKSYNEKVFIMMRISRFDDTVTLAQVLSVPAHNLFFVHE